MEEIDDAENFDEERVECGCAICSTHLDFTFDPHLVDEIERHNCVIFAGAGVSTETSLAHPNSFYEQIRAEVECEGDPPFPELMATFEKRPNGRQKLIEKILDRFEYIDSFRELRLNATIFHRELSTMPYFKTIVTTNWDRYFEDNCGATPFVYESDIPFWEIVERPVLKLHGSVDNYASIIATTDDYVECERRLRDGAMGAVLKQIFATKTCIFSGYSATDPDFLHIYETIQSGLGSFRRTHYLVSPFIKTEDSERLRSLNIVPVKTDASHFLSVVKEHMCSKYDFARDETYDQAAALLLSVVQEHHEFTRSFDVTKEPHLMLAAFYQDGLIHALERLIDMRRRGTYSDLHKLRHLLEAYEEKIAGLISKREYTDVAYFEGYTNGLLFFLWCNDGDEGEDVAPPLYFHPGAGEFDTKSEYEKVVRGNPTIHKSALKQATQLARKRGQSGLVMQHMPWG